MLTNRSPPREHLVHTYSVYTQMKGCESIKIELFFHFGMINIGCYWLFLLARTPTLQAPSGCEKRSLGGTLESSWHELVLKQKSGEKWFHRSKFDHVLGCKPQHEVRKMVVLQTGYKRPKILHMQHSKLKARSFQMSQKEILFKVTGCLPGDII